MRVVLPLTIAAAPLVLWPYRGYVGIWMVYVGLAANMVAIVANGGLMPIERSTVVAAAGDEQAARYVAGDWIAGSKDVLVDTGQGRLVALGDGLVVPLGSGGFVASPGDVVVWAGLVVLAAQAAVAWQRRPRISGDTVPSSADPTPRTGGARAEGGAPTPS